jgi:hypothetical protein
MKKTLSFFAATVLTIASFAQSFEGKISYVNTYKSKMTNVTDEQFTKMMGSQQVYCIKEGDYKSFTNGQYLQWQLYVNQDNKLYSKVANSESLLWNDGAANADEVLKSELNKSVTTIAGYLCDELVLTCKSGIQKYYFSSQLGVNPALFINHKFGNWYELLSRSKSLPLKMVVDNSQMTFESTATEVVAMQLDKTFFMLPPDAKTMKSPY